MARRSSTSVSVPDRVKTVEKSPVPLERILVEMGAPPFHARQVFHWIWARGVTDFEQMTDLSRALRARLAETFRIETPTIVSRQVSADGTTKFLLRLSDGGAIESVYIPDTPAQTFCVSTQVGCAMNCAFCLTGRMGLTRHLTADEIAGQVRVLAHETGWARQGLQHRPDGHGRAAAQL